MNNNNKRLIWITIIVSVLLHLVVGALVPELNFFNQKPIVSKQGISLSLLKVPQRSQEKEEFEIKPINTSKKKVEDVIEKKKIDESKKDLESDLDAKKKRVTKQADNRKAQDKEASKKEYENKAKNTQKPITPLRKIPNKKEISPPKKQLISKKIPNRKNKKVEVNQTSVETHQKIKTETNHPPQSVIANKKKSMGTTSKKPSNNKFSSNPLFKEIQSRKLSNTRKVKNSITDAALSDAALSNMNLEGDINGESSKQIYNPILYAFTQQISEEWDPPVSGKKLICTIDVYLSPTGEVIKIEILKSSGEVYFDELALEQVKKRQRFYYKNLGVLPKNVRRIKFTLDDFSKPDE